MNTTQKKIPLPNLRFALIAGRLGFKNVTIQNYLEISKPTYHKIVKGDRDLTSSEILKLEELGINHSWLLGFSSKMFVHGMRYYEVARKKIKKHKSNPEKYNDRIGTIKTDETIDRY